MANRYQGHPSGNQPSDRGSGRGSDRQGWDDEGRFSSAEDDRNYGTYTENDEGDSSVRAGSYDEGRARYGGRDWSGRNSSGDDRGGRDTNERSGAGSSGRFSGYGNFGQGDYGGRRGSSGQDQGYQGQQGMGRDRDEFRGGNYGGGTYGRGNYGDSGYGEGRGGRGGSRSFSGYGYEGYGSGDRESGQSGNQWGNRSGRSQWGQSAGEYDQRTGLHHGKGPKGYQRSDERLKELICERLHDDPEIDPSEVTINVQGGKVTLEGTVDSRHAKNAIEDVAEQFGVQEVQNNLRVQRVSQAGEGTRLGAGRSSTEDGATGTPRQNKH